MNKIIKVGSDFCGVGAFNQSLKRNDFKYKEQFACDFNYYARMTFIHNYGTPEDVEHSKKADHKTFADGMEVIALGQTDPKKLAVFFKKANVLGNTTDEKISDFRKKANQFASQFSFYYPFDVYDREIPEESLDVYMTSPPCQAFSLAGKRKGEYDVKGVLFYNSHEFIQKNKPRFFIFENVKGLLSDDNGKTFQKWVDYLGGKSVNGTQTMFPDDNSAPYHIYYQVLNAKNYGVPQNRERVFIVGIRDDTDNNFTWPKEEVLTKRLKDVLESEVDEKYYLSEKMIEFFIKHTEKHTEKGNGFKFKTKNFDEIGNTITNPSKNRMDDNFIKIQSATTKGYEVAEIGEDRINLEHPNSETRRGRVGKSVAQTLTTSCNQGVAIGAIRGRNIDNPKSRESGLPTTQMLEINENGTSNCLTTVQKDNVMVDPKIIGYTRDSKGIVISRHIKDFSGTIHTSSGSGGNTDQFVKQIDYRIRKLTPRECFRLMDFPEDFYFSVVSDSQAYKQAGNSIVVNVLAQILSKLNF